MKQITTAEATLERPLVSQRALHYALLGLVLLLGAALRLYQLGAESYWVDEVALLELLGKGRAVIVTDFVENGRPPVYVWLAYGWVSLLGTSEAATRFLSALCGIAALPLLYIVGAELFNRRVGLLATLIMALAELQITHAQNFRYYSLMVLLTLVSFLCYYRALRSGRLAYQLAWVVASLLLFYTHYFGVFVFPAQTLHLLTQWRRVRHRWASWLIAEVGLYTAPAIQLVRPLVQRTVVEGGGPPGPSWLPAPSAMDMVWTLRHYTLPDSYKETALLATVLLVVGLSAFWLVRGPAGLPASLRGVADDLAGLLTRRSASALLMLWLLCPIVLPFVLSLVIRPMYMTRYTLSAAPAFYLLLACAIVGFRRLMPVALSVSVLAVLIVPGLYRYYVGPYYEQWRESAAYVTASAQPGDTVIIAPDGDEESWYWYYRGKAPQCAEGERLRTVETVVAALAQCGAQHERVWLLWRDTAFPPGANDEFNRVLGDEPESPVRLEESHDFTGLYLYLVSGGG